MLMYWEESGEQQWKIGVGMRWGGMGWGGWWRRQWNGIDAGSRRGININIKDQLQCQLHPGLQGQWGEHQPMYCYVNLGVILFGLQQDRGTNKKDGDKTTKEIYSRNALNKITMSRLQLVERLYQRQTRMKALEKQVRHFISLRVLV